MKSQSGGIILRKDHMASSFQGSEHVISRVPSPLASGRKKILTPHL